MEYTAEQQQYQQQYQYQYEQQTSAAYEYEHDPSSSHYHQSTSTAYYAYPNQHQFQYNHQQQQQQFQYYPPQVSYSQHYSQFYQDQDNDAAAPIHPPGVPLDLDPAHQNHPSLSYQLQPAPEPHQQQQVVPDSAAAPANFAGNINLVHRGNPPPQIQPAYRVGKRGARPFRAGNRGHVGNRATRPDGSAPTHNKGRGPKGSKQFYLNGVTSANSNSILDPSGSAAVMPPSASVPGQATLPAQVPTASLWPPARMAWCDLCRVDCNRPEILEQHKNGKRHKKNLRAHEELQKLNKVVTGEQGVQVLNSGSEVVQLEKVEGSEEKQHQPETILPFAVTNENKKETEHQKDTVKNFEAATTDSVEGKRKLRDPSEARGHGLKRKMKGGRGGKYMKSNEGPRRPVEPPKPKGVIPFMCELCNVKCESQVVFNSHLAGKKHIANLKRFHGHSASYEAAGLQALYPSNFNAPSPSFIPQIQQGVTDPQVVLAQLLTYVLSQAQVSGLAAPQVPLPAATSMPAYTPLSSSVNHYPQKFTQGSSATFEVRRGETMKADAETCQEPNVSRSEASPLAENDKVEIQTSESEKNEVTHQQYFTAEFEVPPPAETQPGVGALDSENQAASPPMDNTNLPLEYVATGDNKLPSSTLETDNTAACKIVSSDNVDKGSDHNLDGADDDPEEEVEDDPEELR